MPKEKSNSTDKNNSTDEKQQATLPPDDNKPELPEKVTLQAPHGFIDESNVHRYWQQGQEVTDPDEIALLHARKAPLVGVQYEE